LAGRKEGVDVGDVDEGDVEVAVGGGHDRELRDLAEGRGVDVVRDGVVSFCVALLGGTKMGIEWEDAQMTGGRARWRMCRCFQGRFSLLRHQV
jgi:hypothetical protein